MTEPVYFIQDLAIILLAATLGGFICTRIGLSPVVGYLGAGLIVGTSEITFPYVTDESRLEIIAQLGVVFLMFSIGLQFRLHKIQELGFRIVFATATTAILVLTATRFAANLMGLSEAAGICVAAIFMVSSSAIIGKLMQEQGLGHHRFGQVALSMTLLEDIVAVVMLAVLASYLAVGETSTASPLAIIGTLTLFAILILFLGFLLVPRLLQGLDKKGEHEMISILVAGLILGLALLAVRSGYSLALGAFLFGMVISETPQRKMIGRTFQGLRDVFLTVFFVTIGMSIDLTALPGVWYWILLGAAGALIGRSLAAFASLLLIGERTRNAFAASLCLTPIGEFSFIIAGIAVAGNLLPETFQVVAVGTALLTSLVSPLLATRAPAWGEAFQREPLRKWDRRQDVYASFWEGITSPDRSSLLWKLLRRRLLQILREGSIITAFILFAPPLLGLLEATFLQNFPLPEKWFEPLFWLGIFVLCIIPLLAMWRNFSAVVLIVDDYLRTEKLEERGLSPAIQALLRFAFGLLMAIWIWNWLPPELSGPGFLVGVLVVGIPLLTFGRRHLIRWHSQVESALETNLKNAENSHFQQLYALRQENDWPMHLEEYTLPENAKVTGSTLADTNLRSHSGCSVVGIERHGYSLRSIGPGTHLFPGDTLLILGSPDQVKKARDLLGQVDRSREPASEFGDLTLESIELRENNPAIGRTLAELDWPRQYQVQVVGLRRPGESPQTPYGNTRLQENDNLLLLGRQDHLTQCLQSLVREMPTPPETIPRDASRED